MGADFVTWALDQLGFTVNTFWAWVILVVGLLLVGGAGIGGWMATFNRRKSDATQTIQFRFISGESSKKEVRKVTEKDERPKIHVESHNQTGGITAYQVNIQRGDRVLDASATSEFKDFLRGKEFKYIDVTAVMGDGEAFRFATQIKNFLESEGHTVHGISQALFKSSVEGAVVELPNAAGVIRVIVGNHQ